VSVSEEYAEFEASMVFQDTTLFKNFSIPQIGIKVKYLDLALRHRYTQVSATIEREIGIIWKGLLHEYD
jgi:hypothetical protein